MTPSFDLRRYQDPLVIQRILRSAKTVAVVGLSSTRLHLRLHLHLHIPHTPPHRTQLLQLHTLLDNT